MLLRCSLCFLFAIACSPGADTQAPAPSKLTGPQYMAAVRAARPQGPILIRARMEQRRGEERQNVLNIQIKRRSLPDGHAEQLYRVTFSKDPKFKGAGLLMRTTGKGIAGSIYLPASGVRKLTADDSRTGVFGTDLTLEDLAAEFLNWRRHDIVGSDKKHGNPCVIVESKPDGSAAGGPSRVRSWMEERRYIAWRVEIYDKGDQPSRIEETADVMRAKNGYWFPRTFTISTPANGTSTEVAGTSSDSDVQFTDTDFSEAALTGTINSSAK